MEKCSALWAAARKNCHNAERFVSLSLPLRDSLPKWKTHFSNYTQCLSEIFLKIIWLALRILRHLGKACSRWITCPDRADWWKRKQKISWDCPFKSSDSEETPFSLTLSFFFFIRTLRLAGDAPTWWTLWHRSTSVIPSGSRTIICPLWTIICPLCPSYRTYFKSVSKTGSKSSAVPRSVLLHRWLLANKVQNWLSRRPIGTEKCPLPVKPVMMVNIQNLFV